jgi:hypothetical protein
LDGLKRKGSSMAKGSLREEMPVTAALIDEFRKVFGAASIDGMIRRGMRGEPVFFASENGHTVGTPVPLGVRVLKDARGNPTLLVDGDGNVIDPKDDVERRWVELKGAR